MAYLLNFNDNLSLFRDLEELKEFFIECEVKEGLMDEDGKIYLLEELDRLVDEGEKHFINKGLIERGDDYFSLDLKEVGYMYED